MAELIVTVLVRSGFVPKTIARHLQMLANSYKCRPIVFRTKRLLMGTSTTKSAMVFDCVENSILEKFLCWSKVYFFQIETTF